MAQGENNPDTFGSDQLFSNLHKAVAMRIAGIILILSGIGVIAAGGCKR